MVSCLRAQSRRRCYVSQIRTYKAIIGCIEDLERKIFVSRIHLFAGCGEGPRVQAIVSEAKRSSDH